MFWNDEEADDQLADNLNKIVDGMAEKRNLIRFLLFCGFANLIIWLCVIIFPAVISDSFVLVNDVSDKIGKATLAVPFGLGLFLAYSLFRLKFPDIEEQKLDSDLMASYRYQAHSLKRWWIWFFSVLAGILNVLLLMTLAIFLSVDYRNL